MGNDLDWLKNSRHDAAYNPPEIKQLMYTAFSLMDAIEQLIEYFPDQELKDLAFMATNEIRYRGIEDDD